MKHQQQRLAFTARDYPLRPPLFVMRVFEAIKLFDLVKEVGLEGVWLLMCIAKKEDEIGYQYAPAIHNQEIYGWIDATRWHTFNDLRQRLVQAGWLTYLPRRRQAGIYWVNIPDEHLLDELKSARRRTIVNVSLSTPSVDQSVDQSVEPSSLSLSLNPPPPNCKKRGRGVSEKTETQVPGLTACGSPGDTGEPQGIRPRTRPHRICDATDDESRVPTAAGDEPSPGSVSRLTERSLAERLSRLGVQLAVEAVTAGLNTLATDDESREHTVQRLSDHVDHFCSKPGAWGAAALYRRFTSPSLHLWAPHDCWPPPLEAYRQAESQRRESAQRLEQQREQDAHAAERERTRLAEREHYQQLELTFATEVDALSLDDALQLLTARNAFLATLCQRQKTDPRREPQFRRELLKSFAAMAASN